MVSKASALALCVALALAGCASARQLQQGGQQGQVDIGGLVNQIGQVATQGISSVLQQNGQPQQGGGNGSLPLAGIGNALSTIGAQLNNRTGAPAGSAPPPPADSGLLADPTEITATTNRTASTNTTGSGGGLAGVLSGLTSGLANATGTGSQQTPAPITSPPGIGKSAAGAAASSSLAGLAAAALLLVQLMA